MGHFCLSSLISKFEYVPVYILYNLPIESHQSWTSRVHVADSDPSYVLGRSRSELRLQPIREWRSPLGTRSKPPPNLEFGVARVAPVLFTWFTQVPFESFCNNQTISNNQGTKLNKDAKHSSDHSDHWSPGCYHRKLSFKLSLKSLLKVSWKLLLKLSVIIDKFEKRILQLAIWATSRWAEG